MRRPRLLQCLHCGCVGLCLLRYRFSPWITLATASLQLLRASGVQRTREQIRCLSAISKIDAAGLCGLLNDLLW